MLRHLRYFVATCLAFLALVAELTCYWLEIASDNLHAAACGLTED